MESQDHKASETTLTPRIAILLASYQGEDWIHEQLESIFRSEGVEPHVFVSDDGSTDRTLAIVGEYPATKVTVLPQNASGSAGQNFIRLIRDAPWQHYDYIALSDQDDVWHADKLRRAVDLLKNENHDVYSSNVTAFWGDGRSRKIDKAQPQRRMDFFFEAAGPGNTYVFSPRSMRVIYSCINSTAPDVLRKIELHDWLLYALIRAHGYNWFIDCHSGLDYRQHANNVMGDRLNIHAIRRRLSMLYGDWYFNQVREIMKISGVTGIERDFVNNPDLRGLFHMLRYFRDYRRKFIDACILASAFVWFTIRQKRG